MSLADAVEIPIRASIKGLAADFRHIAGVLNKAADELDPEGAVKPVIGGELPPEPPWGWQMGQPYGVPGAAPVGNVQAFTINTGGPISDAPMPEGFVIFQGPGQFVPGQAFTINADADGAQQGACGGCFGSEGSRHEAGDHLARRKDCPAAFQPPDMM